MSTATGQSHVARLDPKLRGLSGRAQVSVVVRLAPGRPVPRAELRALGVVGSHDLPLIGGFSASLPAGQVVALAALPGVDVVSRDRVVRVQADERETAPGATGATMTEPATAAGASAASVVRAPSAWAAGRTGGGVTVAVVDTGIATVPQLAGRIVPVSDSLGGQADCYDLSGTGTCADQYGHGTFMAGLIAGGGAQPGVAPGARLLSVKIAGPDGSSDVSTVLAALQWVVSFRQRYGIRVLNLSLGTDASQPWRDDPLNYAVERAWNAGIVVVAAAGNNGPSAGTVSRPADDPWVVTAGAVDDHRTLPPGDDSVPDFSSRGPTREGLAKPDLAAPGGHVLSLRSPGSTLERLFPDPDPGPYRRGSGTSMSAAVVSGVAALVVGAHPGLGPNQVKYVLTATARQDASTSRSAVGSGLVDAQVAVSAPPAGSANAGLPHATGRGDLGLSRGSVLLTVSQPQPVLLTGRETAQLLLWDPVTYTTGVWTPLTWYTSANALVGWNTSRWADTTESGHNWTGHNWTGSTWYGQSEPTSSYGRTASGSASYGGWD